MSRRVGTPLKRVAPAAADLIPRPFRCGCNVTNARWVMHPGLWMMAGALAYPVGIALAHVIIWRSASDRGYAFGS